MPTSGSFPGISRLPASLISPCCLLPFASGSLWYIINAIFQDFPKSNWGVPLLAPLLPRKSNWRITLTLALIASQSTPTSLLCTEKAIVSRVQTQWADGGKAWWVGNASEADFGRAQGRMPANMLVRSKAADVLKMDTRSISLGLIF